MNDSMVAEPVNQEHTALLMPGIERPLMQVLIRDADLWGDALARGLRQGVSIERQRTVETSIGELRGYVVPERRGIGRRTGVVVARDYAGDVWVGCGCTEHTLLWRPCLHGALAVADAGWWPAGLPIQRWREIPLGHGMVALVDDEDYERVSQHKWRVHKHRDDYYAETTIGHAKSIGMHRLVTGAPPGMVVDHRNHNTLDNRRSNLRVCSHADNVHNASGTQGETSQYRGVSFDRSRKKWIAQIRHSTSGGRRWLGRFDDEIDAALAYDAAARESFGEYAALNFPDGMPITRERDDFEDLDDVSDVPLPASRFFDLDLATQDRLTKRQQVGMAGA